MFMVSHKMQCSAVILMNICIIKLVWCTVLYISRVCVIYCFIAIDSILGIMIQSLITPRRRLHTERGNGHFDVASEVFPHKLWL